MSTTQDPRDTSRRSTAEWTSLAVSLGLILTLVALLAYDYLTNNGQPATIGVRLNTEQIRQSGERYYLPVEVENSGRAAATQVQVEITLEEAGQEMKSTNFTIDFLDGGETAHAVVIFESDPAQGTVRVGGISYLEP